MTSTMSPRRTKVVEQVVLSVQTAGLRKMAIASVDDDAATRELAVAVAAVAARSGRSTLLVDLANGGQGASWQPSDAAVPIGPDVQGRGFDVLSAPVDEEGRAAFNNPTRIGEALDAMLDKYELVLLHVPALLAESGSPVNPIAACAATQGVVLELTVGDVSATRLERAVALLEAAGAHVVGTIVDDRNNPSLGEDMACAAENMFRFAPPLARWFAGKLRASEFLRTPIFQ